MGDVVADAPIAARHRSTKNTLLVMQRNGDTVHLRIDEVGIGLAVEPPGDALIEVAQLLCFVGVVDRKHRYGVRDMLEPLNGLLANALGRRVRRNQSGISLLHPPQLIQQLVVLSIGDGRFGKNVIGVIVPANLVA